MNDPNPAITPVRCAAEVATPGAERYLQQLCKHFRHKRPVILEEGSGLIEFTAGACRLEARDGVLSLRLAAPGPAELEQLQDVVARHLIRFAFREDLQVRWCAR